MTGGRVLFGGLLLLFVAAGLATGWVAYRGSSELRTIQAKIDEQHAAWDDIQAERRKLEDMVASEKERIAELPDSLKKATNAQAMKSSMSFAKAETVIETNEMRVKKRLEFQENEKRRVGGVLARKLAVFGGVEVVLLVALLVVRRRLG
ncbi:MAG: hypothetical protein P8181_14530 [bacterium]